jgi:multiple sugar transport system permease protein
MKFIGKAVILLLLLVGGVIMIYPFVFSLLAGFIHKDKFGSLGMMLPIPDDGLQWQYYKSFFTGDALRPFFNSVMRASWYTFIITLMAVMIGYVLSRLRFPGRKAVFYAILIIQMIPGSLTLIPTYIEMARFPLVGGNNLWGQGGQGFIDHPLVLYIMIQGGAFLWVYLFRQAMNSVPRDFEEAAYMDGSGFFRTLFTVIVPIQKPIIATIMLSNAIASWNDWLTPFIYVSSTELQMISGYVGSKVSALSAFGDRNYPLVFALSTITVIPPLLIFLFFQKYIVQGFASAGIKG